MSRLIAHLAVLLSLWVGTEALVADDESPAEAAARGKQLLQPILDSVRQDESLPAVAAAIVKEGRLYAYHATGVRKWGSDVAVTSDDVFHIGSCTKAMTATLIGMLVQEGKLAWDTPVRTLLPELQRAMHPGYREITVRQLLEHRAGLPSGTEPNSAARWNRAKTPQLQLSAKLRNPESLARRKRVLAILTAKPQVPPGSQELYSNEGYILLGAIAEQVTQTDYATLMTQRLFQPLGMTTAGFGPTALTAEPIDQPWPHVLRGNEPQPVSPGPMADNPPYLAPAGRVHCSIADWARFAALHVSDSDDTLLEPDTRKELHTSQLGGLHAGGWLVVDRPWANGKALSHAGSNTMNYALAWLAPNRGYAILVATNVGPDRHAVCDRITAEILTRHGP